MVYGQTGTGKSFTMCSFDPRCEGIIPRAMRDMFEIIEADTERVYTINFSFIHIYLDKLQDLFNPDAGELKITRDKNGVAFPGIVSHVVKDGPHFRELYEDGHQHRVITATKISPESSRGHASLFIQVNSVPRNDPGGENREGKLFLIDLAGYERFSKTGVQEGLMAQEAKTINGSLLALGSVVQGLSERNEHVPWRNAKLTRMLEDAIGGKAKCSIILTAGPSSDHLHETLGTLYFGSRAMSVKTEAKLSVNIDYKKLAAKLQEMLSGAETKINAMEVEATRRQLEREEAEGRFQSEWARVKKKQEDQLQDLLKGGGSPERIQELINFNQQENDLLEEQHYAERHNLEERHEIEVKESMEKQQEQLKQQTEATTTGMSRDLTTIQKELAFERSEKERFREKSKEAESEARRLTEEVNDLKVAVESSSVGGVALTGDDKKAFDRKIESIKAMLSENFELKMQEVEEPLREELEKYQKLYEDLKMKHDEDIQNQKDALTSMYEQEIGDLRATSHEVQERLKKNHTTIKKSYQLQKERLDDEVEELTVTVAALTKQLKDAGMSPSATVKAPTERTKKSDDSGDSTELKQEISYLQAERDGLKKQLEAFESKNTDDRLNPAQIRQLKSELDELKATKEKQDVELFKLRAVQALSGPEEMNNNNAAEDEQDTVEDLHGDIEGMNTFVKKMQRAPHFVGAQPIVNTQDKILSTIQPDLDEYRRFTKYRIMFIGDMGVGKTSFAKCFMTGTPPIIRNLPEVNPSIHPTVQPVSIEDPFVGKGDWHKLYVKGEDLEQSEKSATSKLLGTMTLGLSTKMGGTSDPARLHLDLIDTPGNPTFWRGLPPFMLAGKGTIYCVMYDLTLPVDIARVSIERQLVTLHACCARNYPRSVGGDAPRVGFCLVGTHRDLMHDTRDSTVQQHLNRVTLSLGEVFHRIRGDDTFGLVCVGTFAVSAKDWSIIGNKDRLPRNFKDFAAFLGTVSTQLYHTRPSCFLSNSKDTASHMTYMLGDELMEGQTEKTAHLSNPHKRHLRGIVTLLTGLNREQKVRWFMTETELRQLVAKHLDVSVDDQIGNRTINFIIRELSVRCLILPLPYAIMEPKYLPHTKDEDGYSEKKILGREGLVLLDPNRLLLMYSLFMCPSSLSRHAPTATYLKDKNVVMMDAKVIERLPPIYKNGIVTEQLSMSAYQRMLSLVCSEPKLLFELFAILGLGLNLRSEVALLSPAHFSQPMPVLVTEYLSYLLGNFGDGVGRKYRLNAASTSFFTRLQTRLIPFSHAPATDKEYTNFNYTDASYLVFEKTRLKWGIFGSKALKDAVMATSGIPIRGILKLEEDSMYIALTAQGKDVSSSIAACKGILNAIHYEISSLTSREFRGIKASYQELDLAGSVEKRQSLNIDIQAILTRFEIPKDAIATQLETIKGFQADPKHCEIENALLVLPKSRLE